MTMMTTMMTTTNMSYHLLAENNWRLSKRSRKLKPVSGFPFFSKDE